MAFGSAGGVVLGARLVLATASCVSRAPGRLTAPALDVLQYAPVEASGLLALGCGCLPEAAVLCSLQMHQVHVVAVAFEQVERAAGQLSGKRA